MFTTNNYLTGTNLKKINLTHGSDLDGIVCAYLFLEKYPDGAVFAFGSPIEAYNFYKEYLRNVELDNVYITDLAQPYLYIDLTNAGVSVTYIDHHLASFKEDLQNDINYNINVEKSAAKILWEYQGGIKKYQKLINLVEIRDLWLDDHPEWEKALKLNIILKSIGKKKFLKLLTDKGDKILWVVEKFEGLNASERHKVNQYLKQLEFLQEKACEKAEVEEQGKIRWIYLKNNPVWLTPEWLSDIANYLIKTRFVDMVAVATPVGKNTYRINLRSKGGVKVNKIAEIFGGGGHPRAASFNYSSGAENIKNYLKRVLSNVSLEHIEEDLLINPITLLKNWVANRKI